MNWRNSLDRYGAAAIALHWLMLLLLIAVYGCAELRGLFARDSPEQEALRTWHYMLGLSVFTLVWLRLVVSWPGPTPDITPRPPFWQDRAAKAVHVLLYGLMIGLPLLGWLALSTAGKPIPFYGAHLPALASANKELARQVKDWHETLARAGYFVVGLHAAAALFHHYLLHDNTLTRMLPARQANR